MQHHGRGDLLRRRLFNELPRDMFDVFGLYEPNLLQVGNDTFAAVDGRFLYGTALHRDALLRL